MNKRIVHTAVQHIDAPPEEVFPLLCPVRESEWADGWEADIVYSDSGFAEKGGVFTTGGHGDHGMVWVITEHDPQAFRVAFTTFTPGKFVALREIALIDNGDGSSTQHITYTFTSLSPQGDAALDSITDEHFAHNMHWWEMAVNHYLKTGQLLRHP